MLKRSSATIKEQIDRHNAAIARTGCCMKCKRAKSPHSTVNAERAKN